MRPYQAVVAAAYMQRATSAVERRRPALLRGSELLAKLGEIDDHDDSSEREGLTGRCYLGNRW
jgi:hypothetical protein